MIIYGDLYDYLEDSLGNKPLSKFVNYHYTLKFCKENNLSSDRLLKILYDFGGHNDFEVLINVARFINDDTPINKDMQTPLEYAIYHNLYTRFHEGMWVRCKKTDKKAVPDLNLAFTKMFPNKF